MWCFCAKAFHRDSVAIFANMRSLLQSMRWASDRALRSARWHDRAAHLVLPRCRHPQAIRRLRRRARGARESPDRRASESIVGAVDDVRFVVIQCTCALRHGQPEHGRMRAGCAADVGVRGSASSTRAIRMRAVAGMTRGARVSVIRSKRAGPLLRASTSFTGQRSAASSPGGRTGADSRGSSPRRINGHVASPVSSSRDRRRACAIER